MFKDNGEVIHFTNPKVQASLGSNTFSISGPSDTKRKTFRISKRKKTTFSCLALQDMLPTIMSQLGLTTAEAPLSSDAARRQFANRADEQSGAATGANGADEDDEGVPSEIFLSLIFINIRLFFFFFIRFGGKF